MSAESANRQATLLCNVCSNLLVFSGLFIAGVMALIGSDKFENFGLWKVVAASIAIVCSFASGLFSITSMMQAHNLSRRSERLDEGDTTVTTASITKARKFSITLALLAFSTAIIATASISIVVSLLVYDKFNSPSGLPSKPNPAVIQLGGLTVPLSVTSEQLVIKVSNPEKKCLIQVTTDGAVVSLEAATPCGEPTEPEAKPKRR